MSGTSGAEEVGLEEGPLNADEDDGRPASRERNKDVR